MTEPAAGSATNLVLDTVVRAPVTASFAALTEWASQGLWLTGTRVQVIEGDGRSVGSRLEAVTGRAPARLVDRMTITRWSPPHAVEVLHTGPALHGTGTLEVLELPRGMSRVVWSETFDLPLGALGRAGWTLARPGFAVGLRRSLRTLARLVETGVLPTGA